MLNSRQKKCVAMMAAGCYTQKEIAKELNISEATICNWKKTDEFMSEYNAALKNSMKDVAAKAFKTETDLLRARSEMVRLMAAKDILDRAGFKPEEKVNVSGGVPVVLYDDIPSE